MGLHRGTAKVKDCLQSLSLFLSLSLSLYIYIYIYIYMYVYIFSHIYVAHAKAFRKGMVSV